MSKTQHVSNRRSFRVYQTVNKFTYLVHDNMSALNKLHVSEYELQKFQEWSQKKSKN